MTTFHILKVCKKKKVQWSRNCETHVPVYSESFQKALFSVMSVWYKEASTVNGKTLGGNPLEYVSFSYRNNQATYWAFFFNPFSSELKNKLFTVALLPVFLLTSSSIFITFQTCIYLGHLGCTLSISLRGWEGVLCLRWERMPCV